MSLHMVLYFKEIEFKTSFYVTQVVVGCALRTANYGSSSVLIARRR